MRGLLNPHILRQAMRPSFEVGKKTVQRPVRECPSSLFVFYFFVSFRLISTHLISTHLISTHLNSSQPFSSHLISSRLFSCRPKSATFLRKWQRRRKSSAALLIAKLLAKAVLSPRNAASRPLDSSPDAAAARAPLRNAVAEGQEKNPFRPKNNKSFEK
jgi:hypothetical protein